jgi:parallel beta helix pectate lyase-like protein
MIAKRNAAARIRTGGESPASLASGEHPPAGRRRRMFVAAVLSVAALAVLGALAAVGAFNGNAAVLTNCSASPSSCNYPDATNTGVPAGTTLKSVPSQVSSGPGWSYNTTTKAVIVNVNGTVLSDLYIPGNLTIAANNVTVKDVQVVTGGAFGIGLTHTTGVTIENSTISGLNLTTGRVDVAISDVYGDSTGMVVKDDNISMARIGVQLETGVVEGNYIHDPGYIAGDHTDGIVNMTAGTAPLTIEDNTIFINLSQTSAISLDVASANGVTVGNKTVEGNFLAGGGYDIYAGADLGTTTSNILIENNRFGQQYYAKSGQFGPDAYFSSTGTGNVWSGNIWDTTGQAITSP